MSDEIIVGTIFAAGGLPDHPEKILDNAAVRAYDTPSGGGD